MGLFNVINRATLASGQPEDVTQVLANLDAIAAILNGGIDNSNINAAAAIAASKLANYPADGAKVLRGDGTWGSAGTTVATTVTGLGAGADGRIGRLRLGATPYQFIDLVYDGTYAHWVSSEALAWTDNWDSDVNIPTVAGVKITTSTSQVTFASLLTRYREAAAAGLTLQYRFTGAIQCVSGPGAGNAVYVPLMGDVGGAFSVGSAGGIGGSVGVGTTAITDTGWFSPAITTKDVAGINLGISPNGASVYVVYGSVYQRWIA